MFKIFKNKYDILEDYLSSLQREEAPSLKRVRNNAELESMFKTAKDLKVLLGRESQSIEQLPRLKRPVWYSLLVPVVTTAVIIIVIILWPKSQPITNYSQEIAELTTLEQEFDANLKILEQDLVDLEEYLEEEEMNEIYQELETIKL